MKNSKFEDKKYLIPYQVLNMPSEAHRKKHHFLSQRFSALLNLTLVTEPLQQKQKDPSKCYYLPDHSLLQEEAIALGIYSLHDLYGGVVPYEFLMHKTLTHPTYHISNNKPRGWNNQLGGHLKPYVLEGYSAFDVKDIIRLAQEMIQNGPVRLKAANANNRQDQWVFRHQAELIKFINQPQYEPLFDQGIIIDENLRNTTTFNIGQTEIGGILISYCGEQVQTKALNGEQIYGGINLFVVRGNYNQLHDYLSFPIQREALHLARQYEQVIFESFPLLYSSRRNYHVLHGLNVEGQVRLGVLDQSWHIESSSVAELMALESFQADPQQKTVQTWTRQYHLTTLTPLDKPELAYCVNEYLDGIMIKYAGVNKINYTNPYSIEEIINMDQSLK